MNAYEVSLCDLKIEVSRSFIAKVGNSIKTGVKLTAKEGHQMSVDIYDKSGTLA